MNPPTTAVAVPPDPTPERRYFPVIATYVILGLNILIFILMTVSGGSKNVNVLLSFGASYGPFFREGEYWRLVMPMFLHIGWEHLFDNMLALWLLGSFLEPLYGYGRFALLYVISGMGGALLSMEASNHPAAGASGAIFGIAGAMLVTGWLRPEEVPRRWKDVFGIGVLVLIVIDLVFGHTVRYVDNWAHLGGLATGLILAWLIPPASAGGAKRKADSGQFILVLPLAIVLLAVAATANHALKARAVNALIDGSARLQAAGHPRRARALLDQARRLEPHDLRVEQALAIDDLSRQKFDNAIREFAAVLRVNPYQTTDAINLALAYEGKNDYAKARQSLQESNRHTPGNALTLEALADADSRLGIYAAAIARYNQALKLAPDFPVAQNNLAWLQATCKDARYRNPREALAHALRAVQLTQSKQAGMLDTLGAALFANGQFALAVRAEKKAVALDPGNSVFQQNLRRYRGLALQ